MNRFLPLIIALLVPAGSALAQSAVRGNGTVVEQVRPLSRFSAVSLDFPATLTVTVGEAPGILIISDENILPFIGTRVSGRTLSITQDKWIKPTARTVIEVGVPTLSSLETSGYSHATIENASGPRLSIDAGVGTVVAFGQVDRLRIRTKTGTIDATDLLAGSADVVIESRGTVKLNTMDAITADIAERGTLAYAGSPEIQSSGASEAIPMAELVETPTERPPFVRFSIRNNQAWIRKFEVQGPEGARFSYGFSMRPLGSKSENWPIGTRVYRVSRFGGKELVYTVVAADSGRTVNLFDR